MLPAIGRELAAVGLGLDLAGAVYLGIAFLDGPFFLKSVIFQDFAPGTGTTPGRKGRPVNTFRVRSVARTMLSGRVGLVLMAMGFGLQLFGSVLPSAVGRPWLPLALAAAAVFLAREIGRRWISSRRDALEEEIWKGKWMSEVVSFNAIINAPRQHPRWKESRFLAGVQSWFLYHKTRRPSSPPKRPIV